MLLKTENLTKTFTQGSAKIHAVSGVDLEIAKGERVYVHGPSGAGKSTLLNLLGALTRPSDGRVLFNGKDIYRMSDGQKSVLRNRHFGFVFQFYYLLPELSVLENVMLPARIKGGSSVRGIREKAERLIEHVGMTHRTTHRPSKLSGGEAQRVAIARSLVNSPEIMFCDEPTGNLDSEMSARIYELLLGLSEEEDMSVVVVSHQEPAEGFYHASYFMKDGMLSGDSGERILSGHKTGGRS